MIISPAAPFVIRADQVGTIREIAIVHVQMFGLSFMSPDRGRRAVCGVEAAARR